MRQIVLLISILLLALSPALAQRKNSKPSFDLKKSIAEQEELAKKASASRESLIEKTKEYKESLESLLTALQTSEKLWAEKVEKRQQLVAQGLMAPREIEAGEANSPETQLSEVREKITDTNKRITQADQFIVEIANLEQMAKEQAKRGYRAPGAYFDNLRYIRYNGTANWSLQSYGQVEAFFQAAYGRSMPVSAFGQSETHNRLGFDHSNSFDVALHPDTAEAQNLMSFLRSRGIPFTAFRGAIPGNATGAHIHIGNPSHRFR